MEASDSASTVAVVGAGIAGAATVRALLDAGFAVHAFDKSHGPGGRMATRRCAWTDACGDARVTAYDHGAPWFSALEPDFRSAVEHAVRAGVVTTWQPRLHERSLPWTQAERGSAHFVAAPDMPEWCRSLVQGATLRWGCPVQALRRSRDGWHVDVDGAALAETFDAVVLALPPAQAAPLLAPHRRAWAQRASLALMQPCWTLMGASEPILNVRGWDIARPEAGVLALVLRNESRPGRGARRDEVHWVVHAKAGWSRAHLEHDAAWVQAAVQRALAEWLGAPLHWRHAVAHRWRYAMPQAGRQPSRPSAWWDDDLRLGVCGDFLGGGGVEGAWLSSQSVVRALLASAKDVGAGSDPVDASGAVP